MLWRVAGPRINSAITNRRGAINGAIAEAGKARADAEAAQAKYEMALTKARTNANALAEETRAKLNAEIAKAKADADTKAHDAMAAADARIASTPRQRQAGGDGGGARCGHRHCRAPDRRQGLGGRRCQGARGTRAWKSFTITRPGKSSAF